MVSWRDITRDAIPGAVDELLRRGINYKQSAGYFDTWRECEKFRRGDQWPAPTERTRHLPRPVLNIVDRVIIQKVAALHKENFKFLFLPRSGSNGAELTDADFEAAQLLREIADFTWETLRMPQFCRQIMDTAAELGTGIAHVYWDETKSGGQPGVSAWEGDIAVEEVDPANFYPDNPAEQNLQKQSGIIVTSRRPLEDVKREYKPYTAEEVLAALSAEADQEQYYETERVQADQDQVTLAHRWWRGKEGINYAVCCQGKLLRLETPLLPFDFHLYPFAVYRWKRVRKRFFGRSEAEDLIPNQKEINRQLAMDLLSKYLTAWPKIRVKPGALKDQEITNQPGEVITDWSTGPGGWGIDYMTPGGPNPQVIPTVEFLLKHAHELAGAHEVWRGQAPSGDMNASAFMILAKQASLPLDEQAEEFRETFVRDILQIFLAFWKHYYTEARLIRITGADNQVAFKWFRGIDYRDMEFDVVVGGMSGSPFDITGLVGQLDRMLANQLITFEEYLEFIPRDVFPYAKELLERRRQQAQQQAALQALAAQLQGQGGVPGAAEEGPVAEGDLGEYPGAGALV